MRSAKYIIVIGFMLLARGQANSESYLPDTDSKKEQTFELYPNPVTNAQIMISANKEIYKIQLLNIVGEQILVKEPELSNSVKLDLGDIKNGIYLVKITFADNSESTKRLWVK